MRVAAVDIGTNSVRLLVADYLPEDLFEGERLRWLDRRVTVTRLGQGVDRSARLADDAVGRTVAVLAGFGEAIRAWGVDRTAAVATSAARDAANRDEFLDRAELALGCRPAVITGRSEAYLSFSGATQTLSGPAPFLVIDPGGGSTEFVLGVETPRYAVSVDIGSVRLTERLLADRPADSGELAAARGAVDEILAESVSLPEAPGTVVGTGGTVTSLGAMAAKLEAYDPAVVHGVVLDNHTVSGLVARLAIMSFDETASIPAIDPARAGVLLAGAVVVERAMRHIGAIELTVSETDILDGLAMELGAGGDPAAA